MRLSELFAPGKDTLVIYSMMFPRGPDEDLPCPSCTQFLDSFDGVVEHAAQRVNVAIVAKAALPRLLAHADDRGWRRLRLLSSAATPTTTTTTARRRTARSSCRCSTSSAATATTIRHFWGSELLYAPPDPGQDPRHAETIDPLWNLFDFAPEGRGTDWHPSLAY